MALKMHTHAHVRYIPSWISERTTTTPSAHIHTRKERERERDKGTQGRAAMMIKTFCLMVLKQCTNGRHIAQSLYDISNVYTLCTEC